MQESPGKCAHQNERIATGIERLNQFSVPVKSILSAVDDSEADFELPNFDVIEFDCKYFEWKWKIHRKNKFR